MTVSRCDDETLFSDAQVICIAHAMGIPTERQTMEKLRRAIHAWPRADGHTELTMETET